MMQEEKQLLLQDLCMKFPYGVKADVMGWDKEKGEEVFVPVTVYSVNTDGYVFFDDNDYDIIACSIDACRLYLRPMSSMTEEEKRELQSFYPGCFGSQWLDVEEGEIEIFECSSTIKLYINDSVEIVDWLNAHHFDYRGLIEKGLALEALPGMYETQ